MILRRLSGHDDRIAMNARFRTRASPAGVDFYAAELIAHFDPIELAPGTVWRRRGLSEVWEQVILPLRCLRRPLISPCNTGPWLKSRQILIVHDAAPMVGPEWFSAGYRLKARFMMRRVGRRARVLASVSRAAAIDVAREAGRDDVMIIPNAPVRRIPCDPPTDAVRDLLDRPFLLSVATSDPRKNLGTLLTAWEGCDRADHSLVLVGGSATHVFAASGARNDPAGIERVGRVDDSDLAHLMDACRGVVTVPFYEGFGRVVVEAQLHGKPAIASDIAAHREVAAPGVVFVQPTDTTALAAAIEDVVAGRVTAPTAVDRAQLLHNDSTVRDALGEAITRVR